MGDARKEKFESLMNYINKFQRKNQYEYTQQNEENAGVTLVLGKYIRHGQKLR